MVLISGGVRSGKSRYAQEQARALAQSPGHGRVLFIATAEASDDEMRDRIARHQQDRPAEWDLREAPLSAAQVLAAIHSDYDVILLDCLTLFVSNILLSAASLSSAEIEARVESEIADLCQVARSGSSVVILVTNEVGMGLHPLTPLGRLFADLAGRANQQAAEEVVMMVCGIPLKIKG
jgi:adenosylcobinamide kinase/adenosylcobinamide-phosphate guanylyltransferase